MSNLPATNVHFVMVALWVCVSGHMKGVRRDGCHRPAHHPLSHAGRPAARGRGQSPLPWPDGPQAQWGQLYDCSTRSDDRPCMVWCGPHPRPHPPAPAPYAAIHRHLAPYAPFHNPPSTFVQSPIHQPTFKFFLPFFLLPLYCCSTFFAIRFS